jgi:heme exporter protein C
MNPSGLRLTTFAAPLRFYALTGALLPWLWGGAALLGLVGLYLAFAVAPTDAVQGEAYRILYLHVPAAWLSMLLYLAMAFWAALGWVLRVRMAAVLARAIAPTGALFTALSLVSGSLWGQPTWGTWWVWDARLTSSLILLFLYLGYLLLIAAIEDTQRADAAGALLALVGAVNVPIIYFSVRWWNTLHQGVSLSPSGGSRLAPSMLAALLVCTLACWIYAFAVIFLRARALVLEREAHTDWVKELKR